jgi:acyl carrier protein
MDLKDKILNVVSSTFKTDINDLAISDTQDDIESWDSIGQLQLVMNLESEFNIKFRTNEIEKLQSISDCISIVNNKTKRDADKK